MHGATCNLAFHITNIVDVDMWRTWMAGEKKDGNVGKDGRDGKAWWTSDGLETKYQETKT
jgi:hypothetical protein